MVTGGAGELRHSPRARAGVRGLGGGLPRVTTNRSLPEGGLGDQGEVGAGGGGVFASQIPSRFYPGADLSVQELGM